MAVSFGGWATWAVLPPVVALTAYVVMLRREVTRRVARARTRSAARVELPDVAAPAAPAVAPEPAQPTLEDPDIVPSVARRTPVQPPERMAG